MGQPNTPPADPVTPPAEPTTPPADPAAAAMATDAGKKALDELRQQIKDLTQQNKALQDRDPVKAIAEALGVKTGGDPKTDVQALTEQVQSLQQQQRDAELRATRLEVAAAKGLTPAQAARLQGATREDLEADAEALKQLFPTSATPGTPAPDPTQGARGGANPLEAQLKAAQDKGDTKEAIRLKTAIAAQKTR